MAYTFTLSGVADGDDVRGIFEDTVRALRAVTPSDGQAPAGVLSAQTTDASGVQSILVEADGVTDVLSTDHVDG